MPKSACYTLSWLSSSQAYELYEGQGEEALDLVLDSPAWSGWVSQLSSFAFHGHHGSYTARQEHRRRGGQYWYAYARVAGKPTKRYLGRGTELTLTRLEQVAQALWLEPQAALHQEQASASARPRPASLTPRGRKTEHESGGGGRKAGVLPVIASLPPDRLLASKLQVPRPRPHLVHRPRLLHQLQQGLERTLILLSAPAGFGKSTLLADWLASYAIPFAWLSFEPQDNDSARFFSYLLAALQTYDPRLRLGSRAQALPHPLQPPRLESLLTALLNDLQAHRTSDRDHVVIVLDDYHVITNEAIHAALRLPTGASAPPAAPGALDARRPGVVTKAAVAAQHRLAARVPATGLSNSSSDNVVPRAGAARVGGAGAERCFDFVASRDDVEQGKADPEIYLLAARVLGVPPADCLAIEDSPAGVKAALAAGIDVVAVSMPPHTPALA